MVTVLAPALLLLAATGLYHRLQAARSGDHLDRRKEGVTLLFGIRLTALATLILIIRAMRTNPAFSTAAQPLAGILLTYASAAWLIWMFRSLGRNITDTVETRTNATLVDRGPYRYVRNPMYTGLLALGAGLGLALSDGFVTAGFAIVFTLLAVRTRIEERYLLDKFGDRYRQYMTRAWRFWPGF